MGMEVDPLSLDHKVRLAGKAPPTRPLSASPGLSLGAVHMEELASLRMGRAKRGRKVSSTRLSCAKTGRRAARASGGSSANGLMVGRISEVEVVLNSLEEDQAPGQAVVASTKQFFALSGDRASAPTELNACLPMAPTN